jgi:hypothetical protein
LHMLGKCCTTELHPWPHYSKILKGLFLQTGARTGNQIHPPLLPFTFFPPFLSYWVCILYWCHSYYFICAYTWTCKYSFIDVIK